MATKQRATAYDRSTIEAFLADPATIATAAHNGSAALAKAHKGLLYAGLFMASDAFDALDIPSGEKGSNMTADQMIALRDKLATLIAADYPATNGKTSQNVINMRNSALATLCIMQGRMGGNVAGLLSELHENSLRKAGAALCNADKPVTYSGALKIARADMKDKADAKVKAKADTAPAAAPAAAAPAAAAAAAAPAAAAANPQTIQHPDYATLARQVAQVGQVLAYIKAQMAMQLSADIGKRLESAIAENKLTLDVLKGWAAK